MLLPHPLRLLLLRLQLLLLHIMLMLGLLLEVLRLLVRVELLLTLASPPSPATSRTASLTELPLGGLLRRWRGLVKRWRLLRGQLLLELLGRRRGLHLLLALLLLSLSFLGLSLLPLCFLLFLTVIGIVPITAIGALCRRNLSLIHI